MAIYFIRNKETGNWANNGTYECQDFEESNMRYWSEKSAKKAMKELISKNQRYNDHYEANPPYTYVGWKPRSLKFEIVAFKLKEVGVV